MSNRATRSQAEKENELDFRIAESGWLRHLRLKTKIYTPEEAKRALGIERMVSRGPHFPQQLTPRPSRFD